MSHETDAARETFRVLYIEDNPMDLEFVREQMKKLPDFILEHADRLQPGLDRVSRGDVNVVLLDLNLPDAPGGLETFVQVRGRIPSEIPVVVFTSIDDEQVGLNAVKKGAQAYLVKGHTEGSVLANSLRNAVERGSEEAFFRTIVFASASPIVVADWRGTVRFVNPAAEAAFQRKAEDWVGRVFGYPVDPDRPRMISLPNGDEMQMTVAETELHEEVLHVIHLGFLPSQGKASK